MPYLCIGGPLHGHTISADANVRYIVLDSTTYQVATFDLLGRSIPIIVESSLTPSPQDPNADHSALMNALAEMLLTPLALQAWQTSGSAEPIPAPNGSDPKNTGSPAEE